MTGVISMSEEKEIYFSEAEAKEIFLEEDVSEEEYDPSGLVGDSVRLYLQQIDQGRPLLTFEQEKVLAERIASGDQEALNELVESNLRLVVSIAKRYKGCGLPFLDLIQEGNIGLITAAQKYDVRKGFRFSTYATWWIRQAISRALSDQSRTIRIPAHVAELVGKIKKASAPMTQDLGRAPTAAELSKVLGVEIAKIQTALDMSNAVASLDTPVGDDEDTSVGDLQPDRSAENAMTNLIAEANQEIVKMVLSTLTEKEDTVLSMRFGIGYDHPHTLEEVGQYFGVTRERIRQIENKAAKKLRHPMRIKLLQEALN